MDGLRRTPLTRCSKLRLRPAPPGASKQPEVRYLDIREGDAIDEAQLAEWIRQASALPGWTP